MERKREVDWMITLIPTLSVIGLSFLFFAYPDNSNAVLSAIRFFFGDRLGAFYILIGIGFVGISLFLAFSRYGNIVLGDTNEKPAYSYWSWGCMMFTCGLAADILFYSSSEWIMYAVEPHINEMGSIQEWAGVFPLFHWSFIPWSFYLVLAVAFGFMLHVKKCSKQRYSEACRAILGKKTDGIIGRSIDLLAVFALLAGTATTFSVATPLMAQIIKKIFDLNVNPVSITIVILIITCIIYTYSLLHGIRGIDRLARMCIYMFASLLIYVYFCGGELLYITETGISSLGKMLQHFVELATYTDPLRTNSFPQNWTIYYWAYWIVWCVAAPFFIGSISKGRTVRQLIVGGYLFGVGSTLLSFIILGNYSMGLQMKGKIDFITDYLETGDIYTIIVSMFESLPLSIIVLLLLLFTMIAFYATSFDSIALTAACYSYKDLGKEVTPSKKLQLLWCVLLILFPIALVFSESSMSNLQSVSIVAAFPIGIVMILIVISFFKDAKKHIGD